MPLNALTIISRVHIDRTRRQRSEVRERQPTVTRTVSGGGESADGCEVIAGGFDEESTKPVAMGRARRLEVG